MEKVKKLRRVSGYLNLLCKLIRLRIPFHYSDIFISIAHSNNS